MAKTFTCKNCHKKADTIVVVSQCTQRVSLLDDNWTDLEVGDTCYGVCPECGERISETTLKRLLGHDAIPDYKAILTTLINDVETAGCEDCGTVSIKSVNEARRALNMEAIE